VPLECNLAMHKRELKQGTKSVLTFFRQPHSSVDLFPSELIKN
jgi:hypothetical protein